MRVTRKALALSLSFLLLVGCGGFMQTARGVVAGGAIALKVPDIVVAQKYAEEAREALQASQSIEAYSERMSTWNQVVDALEACDASLRLVETALDAWEAGGREDFVRLIQELREAFLELERLLILVGVTVPEEVHQFVDVVAHLAAVYAQEVR